MMLSRWSLVIVCFCAVAISTHAAEHTKDSLKTVKKSIADGKAVLVDVREMSEWDRGHISGAEFFPLSELSNGINFKSLQKRLPNDKIVYTHCAIGKRSVTAAEILQKYGYDVRPLKAGYTDLVKAGFQKAEK
jgi:rhodanese-related sulfurtransferase